MKVAIAGSGYAGLETGTCFAEVGIDVVCVDIASECHFRLMIHRKGNPISKWLKKNLIGLQKSN